MYSNVDDTQDNLESLNNLSSGQGGKNQIAKT